MNVWYADSCSVRVGLVAVHVEAKEHMNKKKGETKNVPQNKFGLIVLEIKITSCGTFVQIEKGRNVKKNEVFIQPSLCSDTKRSVGSPQQPPRGNFGG